MLSSRPALPIAPVRRRTESGQILVLFAMIMVMLLVTVGFGVDYGVMLVAKTRLQNAVDAASLAGSRALVAGTSPGVASAQTTATHYLQLHGYQSDAQTTVTFGFPPDPTTGAIDTMRIDVVHTQRTFFLPIIHINQVSFSGNATAQASRRLTDIMLSLDLTGSMQLSGTQDLTHLQQAVVTFINQVNPSSADPLGPKIGMARFAGVMCGWHHNSGDDGYIYLGNGFAGSSEYVAPCGDDKTVLSNLSQDTATLIQLANGANGVVCPAGVSQYACPLQSWTYTAPVVWGTPATPLGLSYNGGYLVDGLNPTYTGTKLPNAVSVVYDPSNGINAWSTANGGRNNDAGEGTAHKVLVLMTDGQNELWPDQGNPAGTVSGWDTEVVQRANVLKLGPDGIAGTADDVEIYVVGFYCTPYYAGASPFPQAWCKSKLASTTPPHACPGPVLPPAAAISSIDQLLISVSSSTPGTCDHYFPIKKTESLPQLFQLIAGQISRGRLQQ